MASHRQTAIAESIQECLLNQKNPTFPAYIPAYFNIYCLHFERVREELFNTLKRIWNIRPDEYVKSFTGKDALVPMVRNASGHALQCV